MIGTKTFDYYEFLQISSHADAETIHRVYRYLAARFHPDNPESGDPEKFFLLKTAYDVLSDPDRRSEYDAENIHKHKDQEPVENPLSSAVDFMDNINGELNRRLAVMAVLYYRRRSNPFQPEVSLMEIERRMGFPRDYLDFTTWYLSKKGYITKADNSDFTLTAEGVDFVESQRCSIPVLNKLLTNGDNSCSSPNLGADVLTLEPTHDGAVAETAADPGTAIIVLPDQTKIRDRRANSKDRRSGAPDWRANKMERRVGARARREAASTPEQVSAPVVPSTPEPIITPLPVLPTEMVSTEIQ